VTFAPPGPGECCFCHSVVQEDKRVVCDCYAGVYCSAECGAMDHSCEAVKSNMTRIIGLLGEFIQVPLAIRGEKVAFLPIRVSAVANDGLGVYVYGVSTADLADIYKNRCLFSRMVHATNRPQPNDCDTDSDT
jgi:hypothetical protein